MSHFDLPAAYAGQAPGPAVLVGGRWALGLGVALVLAFAAINLLHWLSAVSPAALETVVQQPVPADNTPPDPHSDVTAPDPGDNP